MVQSRGSLTATSPEGLVPSASAVNFLCGLSRRRRRRRLSSDPLSNQRFVSASWAVASTVHSCIRCYCVAAPLFGQINGQASAPFISPIFSIPFAAVGARRGGGGETRDAIFGRKVKSEGESEWI